MADQDEVKPEGAVSHINIKVKTNDSEIHFRIKRSTPLSKLMNTYCEKQGKPAGSVRFMLDGARIEDHQTPDDLDMEDGDAIDAMIQQVGGGM